MKIFLVGGLGFIGKRIIQKLSNDFEIVVYASKKSIDENSKKVNTSQIIIEEGLVEDGHLEKIILNHKPDVVIHLAALTGLTKCHDDRQNAFKINVYGTYNVVKSCSASKSRLIFISSREVYGETNSENSAEDEMLSPNNIYGLTKMLGEQIIKNENYNLNFNILRLTNVYGPEGDQYGAQVMIKNALKHKRIDIFGGTQILNYIFVDDVVDIIKLVLNNKSINKEIFNIGSKDSIKITDFVDKISKIIGNKIEIKYQTMRETETSKFIPNIEKLEKILNFTEQTSLDIGIKKTVEWYKEYKN